jgi:hypothetical protein
VVPDAWTCLLTDQFPASLKHVFFDRGPMKSIRSVNTCLASLPGRSSIPAEDDLFYYEPSSCICCVTLVSIPAKGMRWCMYGRVFSLLFLRYVYPLFLFFCSVFFSPHGESILLPSCLRPNRKAISPIHVMHRNALVDTGRLRCRGPSLQQS